MVDGVKAFVSSANFTQRGQERNIEVGVLIDDASFAGFLAGQWLGLVDWGVRQGVRGRVGPQVAACGAVRGPAAVAVVGSHRWALT